MNILSVLNEELNDDILDINPGYIYHLDKYAEEYTAFVKEQHIRRLFQDILDELEEFEL
jgi:hypothetical protein